MSKIPPNRLDQVRAALAASTERYKELAEAFKDMPEPKCSKCGRVIYCGVNGLCKEPDCGLKYHD